MLEELKTAWSISMSWDELADFCERMTDMRKQIREERGIQSPKMRCNQCGGNLIPMTDASGISIRSALFALRNNGVITNDEFKKLDKSWMKHKKKNGLDANGRRIETTPDVETGSMARGRH
jgi:hypothetical protein